jgi:lactocepin
MRTAVFTAAAIIITAMIACAQGTDSNTTGDTTGGGDGTGDDGGNGSGNIPPDGYDGGSTNNNNSNDSGSGNQNGTDSGSSSSKDSGTSNGTDAGNAGKDSGTTSSKTGDCLDQTAGSNGDNFCDTYFGLFGAGSAVPCTSGGNECAAIGSKYCCFLSAPGTMCASDYGAPQCVSEN